LPLLPRKGKVVLISGCDSGFGYLAARKFSISGCKVLAGCFTTVALDNYKNENLENIVPFLLDITNQVHYCLLLPS
jgi:dehydrogenase/reductase SDR family protein 9